MVTTRPFLKIWNNSLSLIKLKPKFLYILSFANILEGKMKRQTEMAASIAINITILKLNC